MIELQHKVDLLEKTTASQLTKIEHTQELHRKAHYNFTTDLEYLTQSVDELRYLVKITVEKQNHFKEIFTNHSQDLHTLYRIHSKHQETCLHTAKAELKHQFDVERRKVFERLFEQKGQSVNEVLELYSLRTGGAKSAGCQSSDHHVLESRATIRSLRHLFTDIKMSVQRWMVTSQSALSSFQGLVYRHVTSEIMGVKLWTVGHIQRKLTYNAKPLNNLKGQVSRNTAKILVLNNTMKRNSCSFPSFTPTYKPRHATRTTTRDSGEETKDYSKTTKDSGEETTDSSKTTTDSGQEMTDHSETIIVLEEETIDYSKTSTDSEEETIDYSKTATDSGEETLDYSETIRQKQIADYRPGEINQLL